MALTTIFNAFTDNFDYIDGEGTGTVTGAGAAGQVSFWDGASSISGDNGLFWDNTNKRLGIKTVSPSNPLHVEGTLGDTAADIPLLFVRNSPTTNSSVSSMIGLAKTTGNMADGFGPRFLFSLQDDTFGGSSNYVAGFGAAREGEDNSGALVFQTYNAGVVGEALRIKKDKSAVFGSTVKLLAGTATGLDFTARSAQNVTNSIYTDASDNLYISGGMGNGKTINFVRQSLGNVITINSSSITTSLNVICSSTSNYIGVVDNIHGAIRNRALWIDDSANITTSPLYGANALGYYGYFGHTWRTTNAAVATADRMFLDREGRWGLGVAPTTHKAIISAGTIASTANALNITGTVSTTAATQNGLDFTITGAGSGSNSVRALAVTLSSGYTGSGSTIGVRSGNSSAGTENTVFATSGNNSYNILGNMGMNAFSNATTTGNNIGQNMVAGGGNLNIGGEGTATSNKAGATNVGLLGIGFNANATSPFYFGGAFYSYDPGAALPTWGTSATLMADNGTSDVDILSIRDNGTAVFTVANGGNVTMQDTNLILGTTTGTKIGTATSQKLGFWNATPIVQPTTSVGAATLVSNGGTALTDTDTFDGYTLKQIVKALRDIGALA